MIRSSRLRGGEKSHDAGFRHHDAPRERKDFSRHTIFRNKKGAPETGSNRVKRKNDGGHKVEKRLGGMGLARSPIGTFCWKGRRQT